MRIPLGAASTAEKKPDDQSVWAKSRELSEPAQPANTPWPGTASDNIENMPA